MELYFPLVVVFALAYAVGKVAVHGTRTSPATWLWSAESARALQFVVWTLVVVWVVVANSRAIVR